MTVASSVLHATVQAVPGVSWLPGPPSIARVGHAWGQGQQVTIVVPRAQGWDAPIVDTIDNAVDAAFYPKFPEVGLTQRQDTYSCGNGRHTIVKLRLRGVSEIYT